MGSVYPTDRGRALAIFTTWPFAVALVLLLVNDRWLKLAYPGIVTGKLSDFAGLAVVALPMFAAFPRHARAIYLGLCGAFLWWKSPASSAFIALMNDMQPLRFGRTVDYGDLIALAILPACAKFVATNPRSFVSSTTLRRWALPPVLAVSLFGVMATSTPTYRKDFNIRAIESAAPIPRDQIVESIKQVAKARGLKPGKANPPHWEGAFEGKGIFLTYSFLGGNEIGIGIQVEPGMVAVGEVRRAEALRDEIKKTLSLRFKGLEFVEPLGSR